MLLCHEAVARGGEAVLVLEDVVAHLGQLLVAVGAQRFALFVGCSAIALVRKEALIVLGAGEAMGQSFDCWLEYVRVSGKGAVGETDADGLRCADG